MLRSFVSKNHCASINGTVSATCPTPAASCTVGVYRLLGTDEWKSPAFTSYWASMNAKVGASCALRRQVASAAFTDYWALDNTKEH